MNKPKPDKLTPLAALINDPDKMAEASRIRQAEAKQRSQRQQSRNSDAPVVVQQMHR